MEQRIRWLYEELPKWVSEGILTPEAVDRLRARYGEVAAPGLRWGRIIWLVLAAVLVAFGALLILSDQWYALAHSVRFNWVVALAVAAQLAVAVVLALEPKAIAWREAAGAFLGIAIPGALQLAGDIYQLSEWNQIAWAIWSLALLLPAVYIVRSTALASIYLILTGVFVSSFGVTNAWLGAQQVWIWLALAAPYFYILYRDGFRELSLLIFSWIYALAIFFAALVALADVAVVSLALATIIAAFTFLVGAMVGKQTGWGMPFRVLGGGALAVCVLLATQRSLWVYISRATPQVLPIVVLVLLLFATGVLCWRLMLRREYTLVTVAAVPLCVTLATFIAALGYGYTFLAIVFMIYYLGGVAALLINGLRRSSLWRTDGALFLLALFIVVRIGDESFTLLQRGTAFVVMGVLILAGHLAMATWQRKQREHTNQRVRRARRQEAARRSAPAQDHSAASARPPRMRGSMTPPTVNEQTTTKERTSRADLPPRRPPQMPSLPPRPTWHSDTQEEDK